VSTHAKQGVDRRTWLSHSLALGAGLLGGPMARAQDGPSALERVKNRGRLVVGLYNDLPPFHVKGQGIEVELAGALAREIGVPVSLLPFNADENMNDDLRNLVWRGHYLGFGPADVLLHVPVDRPLMNSNPRVNIFGPYWREQVMIARNVSVLPQLEGFDPLKGRKVAVPGQSLAGWLMIGADNGALREDLITKLADGTEAAQLLKQGEVVAAAGLRSELEATLGNDARFAIAPLPSPRAPRDGWAVGMAVKKEATDLAQALQGGLNRLAESGQLKAMFGKGGLNWRPV
jgi:ABC-type amino acid transport substrate-binding protein